MFDLTREDVLKTLENYEKIMDRVGEVVDDLYDSRSGSFPLDFLFEDEEHHKDWYKNKQEQAKMAEEQAEEQRQKERELSELQRLKEKYEK